MASPYYPSFFRPITRFNKNTETDVSRIIKGLRPFKQATAFNSIRALHMSNTLTREMPETHRPDVGASSLFDNVIQEAEAVESKNTVKEYTFSSSNFRVSPQKLNMLARQIRNLPVEEAIKQMEFSDKRAAKKIMHNLAFAKKNAESQMDMSNMIISQAWVGKGLFLKRIKLRGRGGFGVMHRPRAHIKFILKEMEPVEAESDKRNIRGWKRYKKTWTPLLETKPIYNAKPFYNW
ncbi:ribosomal protein L22/L17 [Mycotypha africana]|uniref:ribosomal protein L22/L17 n=1 Tax=Mycotypha africana TaxID=64632 RepID=UPI0022FFE8AD|nr:ribosomal protein L22/L17 [Mycotypha africana]KAI8973672.1 ribosomal protein L22/L17 [Mycotypha africana]